MAKNFIARTINRPRRADKRKGEFVSRLLPRGLGRSACSRGENAERSRAAPSKTKPSQPLNPLKLLHVLFPFAKRRSQERADSFDVYRRRALHFPSDQAGPNLNVWSPADAEGSVDGAARLASGMLRNSSRLRRRFPAAISEGEEGAYCEWLCTSAAVKLGLSHRAVGNICTAFRSDPGKRVLELYLRSPKLQSRFPHGLLPVGQKRFVKWLLREGRAKHDLSAAEILWFLHETAEQVPQMVLKTWLINLSWQQRFPEGPTSAGKEEFLRWLREEFPGYAAFASRNALDAAVPAAEKIFLHQGDKGSSASENRELPRGVNILSHFSYPSGIQQAALFTKRALENAHFRVSCRDVSAFPCFDVEDRAPFLGLEVFPVTIINVSPQPYFSVAYERGGLLRRSGVYRIAYWAWELDAIPEEWAELTPLLDAIWAPTEFVADAFRKRMPLPVHEVLPGVELSEIDTVSHAELEIPADHYTFLFMFDMCSQMVRKNPLAVIHAFRAAFSRAEKATLVIKVSRGRSHPEAFAVLEQAAHEAGVILVDEVLSRARSYGFIQMCDCFVSLHRAEGFGLCLAEAMLMGKPVVATNYSGNLAFMHPGNSLLVDYSLTEIAADNPIYKEGNRWAEPSIEHAASLMRFCFDNRAQAAALGAKGQAEAKQKLSLKAAGQRMAEQLATIGAFGGGAATGTVRIPDARAAVEMAR
jgi:glycosyltransferase involved in cell wall biosynthesis